MVKFLLSSTLLLAFCGLIGIPGDQQTSQLLTSTDSSQRFPIQPGVWHLFGMWTIIKSASLYDSWIAGIVCFIFGEHSSTRAAAIRKWRWITKRWWFLPSPITTAIPLRTFRSYIWFYVQGSFMLDSLKISGRLCAPYCAYCVFIIDSHPSCSIILLCLDVSRLV